MPNSKFGQTTNTETNVPQSKNKQIAVVQVWVTSITVTHSSG